MITTISAVCAACRGMRRHGEWGAAECVDRIGLCTGKA